MGQRLVVTLERKGKAIANAYYHWSAYTRCAIDITNTILDTYTSISNKTDFKNDVDLALYLFKATEAGLTTDEMEYVKTNYPEIPEENLFPAINRNCGLVAVSEDAMAHSEEWSEGDVYIDLDNETVAFGVTFYEAENREDFKAFLAEEFQFNEDDIKHVMDSLVTVPVDIYKLMSFYEYDDFAYAMQDVDVYFETPDGVIHQIIE